MQASEIIECLGECSDTMGTQVVVSARRRDFGVGGCGHDDHSKEWGSVCMCEGGKEIEWVAVTVISKQNKRERKDEKLVEF